DSDLAHGFNYFRVNLCSRLRTRRNRPAALLSVAVEESRRHLRAPRVVHACEKECLQGETSDLLLKFMEKVESVANCPVVSPVGSFESSRRDNKCHLLKL